MTKTLEERPEIWLPVVGYEGLYMVSNNGGIRSLINKKVDYIDLKPWKTTSGYLETSFAKNKTRRAYKAHVVVAQAFIGEKNGKYVNHMNGDKTDNRIENLEYVSRRENANHCLSGKYLKGVCKHPERKVYQAKIRINGKHKSLGVFKTEIEAHNAYKNAVIELGESKYV